MREAQRVAELHALEAEERRRWLEERRRARVEWITRSFGVSWDSAELSWLYVLIVIGILGIYFYKTTPASP